MESTHRSLHCEIILSSHRLAMIIVMMHTACWEGEQDKEPNPVEAFTTAGACSAVVNMAQGTALVAVF